MSFERIAARDLQAHDGNWRTHPQYQQDALRGVLDEVGIAGALLVYRSPAHDGAFVTIDGHLRTALDPAQTWPCLVLDVDDAEAALLLATHDPLAALAFADADRLRELLETVQSGEPAIQEMLTQLAEDTGIIPPRDPENPADHWKEMPEFHQENQTGVQQIIVHFASAADVEAFAVLIEQKITPHTRSTWYPYREPELAPVMRSL
jgi:hypothetical protein